MLDFRASLQILRPFQRVSILTAGICSKIVENGRFVVCANDSSFFSRTPTGLIVTERMRTFLCDITVVCTKHHCSILRW